jgi:cholesterol transport system auxiliary component
MNKYTPEAPARRRALHDWGMRGAGLVGLTGLSALTGCNVINAPPGVSPAYYQLQDLRLPGPPTSLSTPASAPPAAPVATPARAPAPGSGVLMMGHVSAAALHDSDRMVYTRDGLAYAYYQFAHWSERPGKRLAVLTEQRLARSGRYAAVVPSVAGVKGDWMLQLRLDDLTHDDRRLGPEGPAGRVTLSASVTLVDWRQRGLVARESFESVQPVTTADARGAAQAASRAITALLDALETWLSEVTPRPEGR